MSRVDIGPLEWLLKRREYEMEVERTPEYFPPFIWIFAVQGEKRIPICSTQSYFLSNRGLSSLPHLIERQLREGKS